MSIETLLTLLVAACILAAAAFMRLITWAAARLVKRLMHYEPETAGRIPRHAADRPSRSWGEVARRGLQGATMAALFVAAILVSWAQGLYNQTLFAGRMTAEGFVMVALWVWPRIVSSTEWTYRRTQAGYRWTRPRVVASSRWTTTKVATSSRWTTTKVADGYRWARPRSVSAVKAAGGHSKNGAAKTQQWWQRRMVPALHQLVVDEQGATWPARRIPDYADEPEEDPEVFQLGEDGLRLVQLDEDEPPETDRAKETA
jgi:hypothetical protein